MMKKIGLLLIALSLLALTANLAADSSLPAAKKRSKSDKDISAIGQRKIVPELTPEFIGREEELGKQLAAAEDQANKLVADPQVTTYIAKIAAKLALHSDADMAIEVRVVDRDDVDFCTLPAGYQYVTRGMLLRMQSEGELASLLARGTAHTALHTYMRDSARVELAQHSTIPAKVPPVQRICTSSGQFVPLANFRRGEELDADFFGIQYVYTAGYDPEDFVRFVQRVWEPPAGKNAETYGITPFPPLSQRVKALREEIAEILPARDAAVLSTSDFEQFQEHLRAWGSAPTKIPSPSPIWQGSDSK